MMAELALTADADVGAAAEQLRRVLLPAPVACDRHVGDDGSSPESLTPASVLFPIVRRETGWNVLLTQRTDHLRDHPGQISFPGGRVEDSDASLAAAALREATEEIGLPASQVEVLGYLPEYRTGTGYRITPVVGCVTPPFTLSPDPREVAEVFEVPLAFLLDAANYREYERELQGRMRRYFAVPYERYFIWGATAGIIVSLSSALRGSGPEAVAG